MKHEIDLSKFNFNSDLALESIKYNNINNSIQREKNIGDIKVIEVNIDKKNSLLIKKKEGKYITIQFDDVSDTKNKKNIIKVLTDELKNMINVKKKDLIMIVGLGNIDSTPDSLGPKVIDGINVTNHIYELGLLDKRYRRICSIKTSVYSKTGIETSLLIKSVVKEIKPSLIIVIDSLASASIDRLNKTIQITDTGINPGSGVGNNRKEISYDTLNIPVIAIGVPTVVSVNNILYDLYGDIPSNEKINELIVTPVEIDDVINDLSYVISKSLNKIYTFFV